MKKIIYQFNAGTEDNPVPIEKTIECNTQEQYDANYTIAEEEAVGEIIVEGEFKPEQDNASTDDVLNALLGVNV